MDRIAAELNASPRAALEFTCEPSGLSIKPQGEPLALEFELKGFSKVSVTDIVKVVANLAGLNPGNLEKTGVSLDTSAERPRLTSIEINGYDAKGEKQLGTLVNLDSCR